MNQRENQLNEESIYPNLEQSLKSLDTTVNQLIFFAYLSTAFVCMVSALKAYLMQAKAGFDSGTGLFAFSGLVVLLMGLNKKFNFLSELAGIARKAAWEHDLYSTRQDYQVYIVLGVLGICLGAAAYVLSRQIPWSQKTLGVGMLFTLCLIITRSISLHQVDYLLRIQFFGFKTNWLIELSGIATIFISTLFLMRIKLKYPPTTEDAQPDPASKSITAKL